MKNNRFLTLGIIGVITIAVTFSIFLLLDFERTNIHWLALSFVLLAEVSLFGGLMLLVNLAVYRNKVFVRSGVSGVLSLYFIVTVITALFAGAFKNNINNFIIIQILIIAIAAILLILITAFSRRINSNDKKIVDERPRRGGF